ncbi:hypothetical protein SAMN05216275_10561 [Streptosporangium canum]|uniref:Uncharacterized protein n=1 Tax=Streptosporangium canum TaxID=324952 RepID=A0A1I3LA41_9ACTN|nr:hypothetical protein [Streptosporangium canum]SFI81420.1 hypothetical protein SAMN05216275_10561 [Streptosporangium canum]
MALAIATSPATVSGNTVANVTTASFTPPNNSLLVACLGVQFERVMTLTNSGAALAWTKRRETNTNSYTAIFTAPLVTGRALTVTATPDSAVSLGMKLFVVTGADLVNPVGAVGGGGAAGATASTTVTAYTSTTANSLGIGVADEFLAGTVSTGADATGFPFRIVDQTSGVMLYKNAATATPGTGVTMTFNGSGAANYVWAWSAIEILPVPVITPFTGWGVPIK